MREHVTLCLLPACPKGNGSVTESPTARSACTSSCPAAPAGRVCLRAPKHPHFKPPPPPPPHLGHGRGCLQPGRFVVGTDFRKPLHVIWSDAGICEVNAIKQKKKRTVCKREGSQPDIPEAGENRKGAEDPAGNADRHPPGRGWRSPQILPAVSSRENQLRTSPMVRWLGLYLPMQGVLVPSLSGDLRSHTLHGQRTKA